MLVFLLSCFFVWISHIIRMRFLSQIFWVSLRTKVHDAFQVGILRTPTINHPDISTIANDQNKVTSSTSFLDLPELAMDSILDRLSPSELCTMICVSTYLRDKCRSDHIWEKHMQKKWGRIIGNVAYREWKLHIATHNRRVYSSDNCKNRGLLGFIMGVWPFWLILREFKRRNGVKGCMNSPPDSIMGWYLSLENGEFWFPAQVYNRENGHDGFVMSCYDAELSYNLRTDSFQARYSPRGKRTIEENVSWSRLRAPPIDASPYSLHISDCMDDLKPGDHFEIQWRRNRGYRYGWWYGVVGHLDECSRIENECICHDNDVVVLEFNHYAPDSRWRRKAVHRKSHREEGNEADGFYGGIRKLECPNEISTWQSLWPDRVLD